MEELINKYLNLIKEDFKKSEVNYESLVFLSQNRLTEMVAELNTVDRYSGIDSFKAKSILNSLVENLINEKLRH